MVRMWQDWIIGFLGVWLTLLAFLGVASAGALIITGMLIAVLGFWGVLRERAESDAYTLRRDLGLYME